MTNPKQAWIAPKLQRLVARDAETGGTGKQDVKSGKS